MTSINSYSPFYTTGYQSTLSASTRRQLEALGIDSSAVTSESQAQSLINAKKSQHKFETSLRQTQKPQETPQTNDYTTISTSDMYVAMDSRAANTRFLLGL